MEKNAEAAMRFVLGVDERKDINFVSLPALPDTTFINTNEREEIQQILNSNNYILKGLSKEKQFYKPRIGAFMDLGSQDFNFGFKPYAFGGIQLELQIFDHKRHNHRINSLSSQLKANNNILDHSRNQIKLQQEVSYKNLTVAVKQAVLLKSRIDLTRKVFKDALRRYREGNGQYLEVIDAQNQVTQIEVQYNLARLKSWQKWSEYLYVSAAYPIK
jgi:outer membrane protein TolC